MPGVADNQMNVLNVYRGKGDEPGDACFTTCGLSVFTKLNHRAVTKAVGGLIVRGYLKREARGCFSLTPAGLASLEAGEVLTSGPPGPHTSRVRKQLKVTLRDRAWRAFRIMGKATIPDLIERSATGEEGNPAANLHTYLRALERAGYVSALPRRAAGDVWKSTGFKRWLLLRNTGSSAPTIRKDGMWDRNLKRLYAFDKPASWSDQP